MLNFILTRKPFVRHTALLTGANRPLRSTQAAANLSCRLSVSHDRSGRPRELQGREYGTETHGGDDVHRVRKLVADFSVTTNAMGPVPEAVKAAASLFNDFELVWSTPRGGDVKALLDDGQCQVARAAAIEHYPKRHDKELSSLVARHIRPTEPEDGVMPRLVFGNGASEVIDLLARAAPAGPSVCINPKSAVQYREYSRACRNAGRPVAERPEDAMVTCVVNPNNPTGDFIERAEMEAWLYETVMPGSWVIVDESMIFWAGPDWHERGISGEFVRKMLKERNVNIFLVHSWTKIYSCTGLRIGSTLCPSPEMAQRLTSLQVPWSLNVFAKTYLKAALQDPEYLSTTWAMTSSWRAHISSRIQRLYPTWKVYGREWLSWIWIDTGDGAIAKSVYEASLNCGCPIRHAAAGYGLPSFIRIAVRRPSDFATLYQALLRHASGSTQPAHFGTYADVDPSMIEGVFLVSVQDLLPHEMFIKTRSEKLKEYIEDLPLKMIPAIIVDWKEQVVIDGHHRLELFRHAGMTVVPAVFVRYSHPDILVNPPDMGSSITKQQVIARAKRGELLPPKSTQHLVRTKGGSILPIAVLSPIISEMLSEQKLRTHG